MGLPAKTLSVHGYVTFIPVITRNAPRIRTSSTPPASPSSRWVRADLVETDTWAPSPPSELVAKSWSSLFPAWHAEAKCRTVLKPDDMFFGEDDQHNKTSLTVAKIRAVKDFCKTCPVFTECLTHALITPERHGIWAGTSKRTRMRILDLISRGMTTVETVVEDYLSGRERQYESIRAQRGSS